MQLRLVFYNEEEQTISFKVASTNPHQGQKYFKHTHTHIPIHIHISTYI